MSTAVHLPFQEVWGEGLGASTQQKPGQQPLGVGLGPTKVPRCETEVTWEPVCCMSPQNPCRDISPSVKWG